MKLSEALSQAHEKLTRHKIEDSHLEAELLLRHALGIARVKFYLELNRLLTEKETSDFKELLEHRLEGEPLAYITGHKEFYRLDFQVSPAVLISRPETELLVEKALELAKNSAVAIIADIGTGCGNIAISLALNLPQAQIYATDISPDALKIALVNAKKHGVASRIRFLQGDLLEPLPEPCDLIVANLPYVKEGDLAELTRFEPRLALDGGVDGLILIKRLLREARRLLKVEGYLLLEIGLGQAPEVEDFILRLYPKAQVETLKDLAGIERVVVAQLTY